MARPSGRPLHQHHPELSPIGAADPFESAVSTFMPLLDDRIEVLDSRLESGTLSQDDQKVLGALRSLRKESNKRLLAHLDANGLEPGVGVGH